MKKAIVFKNVRKNYGQLKAVDGISLAIEEGEFFGLLGPNGAGKSTLINMLAGLVRPTEGSISAMGFDVIKDYQNAKSVLDFAIDKMSNGSNQFYYKYFENGRVNKSVFIRWGQAWMYNAICKYIYSNEKNTVQLK